MTDPKIRLQLRRAIEAGGSNMRAVSLEAGQNPTYIQQFVTDGKPKFLPENIRKLVVSKFGVDEGPLKPPPRPSRIVPREQDAGQARGDAPGINKLSQKPTEFDVLNIWRALSDEMRLVAIGLLRSLREAPANLRKTDNEPHRRTSQT